MEELGSSWGCIKRFRGAKKRLGQERRCQVHLGTNGSLVSISPDDTGNGELRDRKNCYKLGDTWTHSKL